MIKLLINIEPTKPAIKIHFKSCVYCGSRAVHANLAECKIAQVIES